MQRHTAAPFRILGWIMRAKILKLKFHWLRGKPAPAYSTEQL